MYMYMCICQSGGLALDRALWQRNRNLKSCRHLYTKVYIYICIYTYIYVCIHTYMHVYIRKKNTNLHIYVYICTHTHNKSYVYMHTIKAACLA